MPTIAVTAKITMAQMIPVFDGFRGATVEEPCGYAMGPGLHSRARRARISPSEV
jgi:hypothetical protein